MAGKKLDQGKAPIHLVPTEIVVGIAMAFGMGAEKYGEWNYREGISYTRLIDSLLRHTLAFLNGEDNDPESGYPHTWHIGANIAMLEWMRVNKPELDNRYKGKKNATKSKKVKSRSKTSKLRN